MYTVYMQYNEIFYNSDHIIIIFKFDGQSSIEFRFDNDESGGINCLSLKEPKTSIQEVISAIHNAKEKSEQNGVPVILDLTDGTPIVKYPNKTGFK